MTEMKRPFAGYAPRHFRWRASEDGRIATITLDRPEKKNPLTFESYGELRDLFRGLAAASDVRAVVLTGAGGNFSSGGDVFEIIEPLTRMAMPELLAFTRLTGDLVNAMRRCPQPIIAAVDGVCAGARANMAPAPAQTPSTAAMMGCGQRRIALTRSPVMRVKARSSGIAILVRGSMISKTSPPEEKLSPAPVNTTARTSEAAASPRNRSRSSA